MKLLNNYYFTFNQCISLGLYTLVLLINFSCKTPESASYFRNLKSDTSISKYVKYDFEAKIKKDDLLSILITSVNTEATLPFNAPSSALNSSGTNVAPSGYTVDKDGKIYIFKIGSVLVEGYTRAELKLLLERLLTPYLKDPTVVIHFINQKVTIFGEIAHPTVIPLFNEKITLFDALTISGDISNKGKSNNILLIRETDSSRIFKHLNLKNSSIFTSPYYYLKPNDVVYIEPKKQANLIPPDLAQLVSLALSTVSILLILLKSFTNK